MNPRGRQAPRRPRRAPLLRAEQIDLEHQRRARRDVAAGAAAP